MHAKDTPFQFLIREISNISGLTAHPPRAADPTALEFHLAWEITLKSDPGEAAVYLDAVTNELLAVGRPPR